MSRRTLADSRTLQMGKIWIDANLGYKINNLHADYGPGDPEAQIGICHTKIPYWKK